MTVENSEGHSRDATLEAIRGLAAVIVIINHTSLAFWPEHVGLLPGFEKSTWQGNPLYVLMNGGGAVVLFFVLSGYVLTRRYFLIGDPFILLKGSVKRWPRLMGPVLVTVLFSFILFRFHFMRFAEAGFVSHSPWLTNFADVSGFPFVPTLTGAIAQGSFLSFFRGDAYYDSALWTMHPEMIGSFIVFGISPILYLAKQRSPWLVVAITAVVALLAYFGNEYFAIFPVGAALAALLPQRTFKLKPWIAWLVLITSLYLLGYSDKGIGFYRIFASYPGLYPEIIGSVLLIFVVELYEGFKSRLSGPISKWLGEFSFPIYLVHWLVICSLASEVFLHYGFLLAVTTVFVTTFALAYPLLLFNRVWVRWVNIATDKLLSSPEQL